MTRRDFTSDLEKGTRRPQRFAAHRRKVVYESQGKIHGVGEFPILFPIIKITPSRQPGWFSSTMPAIKALYPPLIRMEEKEGKKGHPGASPQGILLHGVPFASFRNDMKYRTNNKKGKTQSSCHRGISAGGTVTTRIAPHSSESLRRPLGSRRG